MESGRSLNLKKCRILVHPYSAQKVVWPPRWRPGICAAIPIETDGAKLLGAPIDTEPFRTDFIMRRVSKATENGAVAALERLSPSATWTVLHLCINERVNYLAQVTEFPIIQDSLTRMDTIISGHRVSYYPRLTRTHGHNHRSSLASRRRLTTRAF
jgi:hypothetical protein